VKFTERASGDPGAARIGNDDTVTVRIEVVDTGIGIPADAQQRIFDGSQADDRSPEIRGPGLNDDIQGDREMLGWRIGPTRPRNGSTFWYTTSSQAGRKQTDAEESWPPTARALIVSTAKIVVETVCEAWRRGHRAAKVGRSAEPSPRWSTRRMRASFDFAVSWTGLDMEALAFSRAVESDR
jgi:two-component system sensor histidine kinase RpfC